MNFFAQRAPSSRCILVDDEAKTLRLERAAHPAARGPQAVTVCR
jgi:hypothetical protein